MLRLFRSVPHHLKEVPAYRLVKCIFLYVFLSFSIKSCKRSLKLSPQGCQTARPTHDNYRYLPAYIAIRTYSGRRRNRDYRSVRCQGVRPRRQRPALSMERNGGGEAEILLASRLQLLLELISRCHDRRAVLSPQINKEINIEEDSIALVNILHS